MEMLQIVDNIFFCSLSLSGGKWNLINRISKMADLNIVSQKIRFSIIFSNGENDF